MGAINILVYLIIGVVIGFFLARFTSGNASQQKELKKDLEKSQYELAQYRQDLIDHFSQSAEILDNISRDYSKLYQHMANVSADLVPDLPPQDNPFAKKITKISDSKAKESTPQEQPRDYSEGTSGFLKENGATQTDTKAS
ncbi:hypothetical protein CS022_18700 [Veronia nyctiphanis]|uniref:Z-ring associated protein G n=1 Tax=Veronia nyctiphanis TaxID=1278244 RepID=A0A4Q0YM51_9GAMM|nr:Z-ring associated protein ZapG [Veronia nyctiphanis]RXJ71912.1 hypothetical protein CS022_18700 [Veronia nyctiphanis]